MKKLSLSFAFLILTICAFAQVAVKGYYRKNGTYVQPHMRSSPDGNPYNNYSYPGNTNPYTGKIATGNPDTYLNNYYNKTSNTDNQSIVIGTTIQLNEKNNIQGKYLKCYYVGDYTKAFYIYDNSNAINGHIVFYTSGMVKLFDNDSNLVKSYNFNDSTTPNLTESTLPSNDWNLPASNNKIYLKDDNGNYTDDYLTLYYSDDIVKKYKFYNHADELIGTISVFNNGNRFYYDKYGKQIKTNTTNKN